MVSPSMLTMASVSFSIISCFCAGVNTSSIFCFENPGKEADVSFATDLRTMIQVWMGDVSYRAAISDGRLKIVGLSALIRDVKSWLAPSIFAGIPPATEIG
jgi:hypothetical protein